MVKNRGGRGTGGRRGDGKGMIGETRKEPNFLFSLCISFFLSSLLFLVLFVSVRDR